MKRSDRRRGPSGQLGNSGAQQQVAAGEMEPTSQVSRSRTSNETPNDAAALVGNEAPYPIRAAAARKKRGLRTKRSSNNDNAPSSSNAAAAPSSWLKPKKRSKGLSDTKFRPTSAGDALSGPGAHHDPAPAIERVYSEQQQQQAMAGTTPSSLQEEDAVPFTAVAKLVTEDAHEIDEEAIRQQAERDAEERLLSNVAQAEVLRKDEENNSGRKWYFWLALIVGLFVIVAVVVAVTVTVTNKRNKSSSAALLVPTVAPATQIPTMVPSFVPTEPLTNDFCPGASELEGDNVLWFSATTDATLDEQVDTCGGDIRKNGRGQWFRIVGEDAIVRAHTCDSRTSFDTQLSVYNGEKEVSLEASCSHLTCVAGNDQYCGDQSFVEWYGQAGQIYYILVHGYRLYAGNFAMEVIHEKNEVCEGALNLSLPIFARSHQKFSIESSMSRGVLLDSEQFPSCDGQTEKPAGLGLWYTFTGDERVRVPEIFGHGDFSDDAKVAVYEGPCAQLSCPPQPQDDFGAYQWDAQDGVTYTIVVHSGGNATARGSFLLVIGLDSEFANRPPPPPPNSDCEEVVSTTEYLLGTNQPGLSGDTYSTFSRTLGSCGASVFQTSGGVWYRAIGSGRPMTVSTCTNETEISRGRMLDTQISVFEGSCDNLMCIDGNDQYCGDQSAVSWFTEAGVDYYILVHGYSTRQGEFVINYKDVEGLADSPVCDQASTIVADGSSILGTSSTINSESFGFCGFSGQDSPGVWFQAVGTGHSWTASTCSPENDFVARVSVYEGTSCVDLRCVSGTVSPCGDQNAVTWETAANQTYYILVHGTNTTSHGKFVLTLEETVSNDNCANAIGPLTADGTTSFGSTRSATFDDNVPACGSGEGRIANGRGVFYTVIGSGTNMTASTCNEFTNHNTQLTLYRGTSCQNLQCVDDVVEDACQRDFQGTWIRWSATLDEVYYLLVHGAQEEIGNYGLDITAE